MDIEILVGGILRIIFYVAAFVYCVQNRNASLAFRLWIIAICILIPVNTLSILIRAGEIESTHTLERYIVAFSTPATALLVGGILLSNRGKTKE